MKIESLTCPNCGAPLYDLDLSGQKQAMCDSCGVPLIFTAEEKILAPIACPKCRALNSEELRFCVNCGDPIKIDCVVCHTANRIDVWNCANCGANLRRAKIRRKESLDTRQRLQRERNRAFQEKLERQQQHKLQRLLDALDEPENHEFALYQINQMGVKAVEPLIETLLEDADPDARYGSARALGHICQQPDVKVLIKSRAVKALIEALADPEAAVRFWSAEALGQCGSSLAVEPLGDLLQDQHKEVRQQARDSLRTIDNERARQLLAESNKGFLGWLKGN